MPAIAALPHSYQQKQISGKTAQLMMRSENPARSTRPGQLSQVLTRIAEALESEQHRLIQPDYMRPASIMADKT